MKIVFASSNAGKIRELESMMAGLPVELFLQDSLKVEPIPEVGLSFVENALLKARHAASLTGLAALADDSGLCVAALKGAPGIYSARYAGPKARFSDNIDKLLKDMEKVPEEERVAAFYTVLVFISNAKDPAPLICQGLWSGNILTSPRGEGGFGYDPIFQPQGLDVSAAELSLEQKNTLSHRAQALNQLITLLPQKMHLSTLFS